MDRSETRADTRADSQPETRAGPERPPLGEILNSLPTAFMLMDGRGLVVEANTQMAALVGQSLRTLLGLPVAEFWPSTAAGLAAAAASTRQAQVLPIEEMEGSFLQAVPVKSPPGGLAVTVFDRRLWQPFFDSAPLIDPLTPYYKKIFESSSDGLSICDREGRLIMVNRASAEHVGLPADQMIGRHVDFLVKHRLIDNTVCVDVLATRRPVTKLIRHYKTSKYILLTGNPIFGPGGEVQLVVINERDLTGMIKLQSSFNRQSRLLARFKDELTAVQLAELASNDVVCVSGAMRRAIDSAIKLARHGVRELLITGESGTGKGLIAKLIHANSPHSGEPFIHLNCAAMPETLLETELFGYEKGLFTGASPQGRAGLIEAAGKGAIFLDEIGEMPLSIQAKFLTFLDNHEFRRIGGSKLLQAPCSVIAATNRNLEDLVDQKLFRQDLYYRLGVFCLHLPPLRERPEDAIELASRELASLNERYGLRRILDPLAVEVITGHDFPGNVRELLNCVHQSVLLSSGPEIGPFLRMFIDGRRRARAEPRPAASRPGRASHERADSGVADPGRTDPGRPVGRDAGAGRGEAGDASRQPGSGDVGRTGGPPVGPPDGRDRVMPQRLDLRERDMLIEALTFCQNTREMASFLGISQASVSRKLKKHQLAPPGRRRLIQPNPFDSDLNHVPPEITDPDS